MYLRDIEIMVEEKNAALWKSALVGNTECLELLYVGKIKRRIKINNIAKINIFLSTTKSSIEKIVADVLDMHVPFDFEMLRQADNSFEKKKILLDVMHTSVIDYARMCQVDTFPLLEAYSYCCKKELKNEWWFKNRFIKSHNNYLMFGILNVYDIDGYYVYLVLLNNEKKELNRTLFYKDDFKSFEFEYFKWADNDKEIIYKFKGRQRLFSMAVISVGNVGSEPIRTSNKN